MGSVPTLKGVTNPLPELMNDRLSEQGHGHLAIADVQVESAGALPTEVLIELEKLLDVPAFGKFQGHGLHFGTVGITEIAFERIFLWALAGALNQLKARQLLGAEKIGLLSRGVARPLPLEELLRQSAPALGLIAGDRHRCQHVKALMVGWIEELGRVMLLVGQDQRRRQRIQRQDLS